MNPPPLPPPLPPSSGMQRGVVPKKKHPVLVSLAIALPILCVAFLGYRIVQFASYMKTHPQKSPPGEEQLRKATMDVLSAKEGVAHGNSPEATLLAQRLSTTMKTIRQTMYEGGDPNSIDMQAITNGEFIVFCQMKADSCAFLVHVPELSRYKSSAKDSIAQQAYAVAAGILHANHKTGVHKLAVATRGTMFYDKILIGDYSLDQQDVMKDVKTIEGPTITASDLDPFFTPEKTESSSAVH